MPKHPAAADIQQCLASHLGQDMPLERWQAVSGGSIHQAWKVEAAGGQCFFIKTNQANKLHTLEAEAMGLAELGRHISQGNPLRVPRVYTTGNNKTHAWLVLEYIAFGHSTPTSQAGLGKGLAMLHQHTAPRFGFEADNVIGENPQTNTWNSNWIAFWATQRLGTQFKLARQHGFYGQIATEAEKLLHVLPDLLAGHKPVPSLLHGDLWGGNAACDQQGTPIIFDPAVYYGDRECDLAITELFGGFSAEFYAAYNDVYPLDSGYTQRKALYNLYHILNHANLFGGGYIAQSKSMMRQLLERV